MIAANGENVNTAAAEKAKDFLPGFIHSSQGFRNQLFCLFCGKKCAIMIPSILIGEGV
jgi:hypothetical protein